MTLNKKTKYFLLIKALFLITFASFAQDTLVPIQPKITFLDSIKKTFVSYKNAKKIDSLWLKDITSNKTYNDILADIQNIDLDEKVDYDLSTDLLKSRLKLMDEKSPFNIEYNIGLENIIKSFLKNRKKSFERLMGISQYYFPLFEEELAKNNIPLEIKYLAVVESALNPKAVSRVGATGLWQFMFQTGKQYGLKIDSYVDERSDPLRASQSASEYMKNMYKIFGDWDLCLAAYNSGPGNVAKAIRRSEGQQNYWNIRKKLPKETQGYLPAFLATMYIFEYHREHGIVPNTAIANHFATDTVLVKKTMTFKQIASLLDISEDELKFFNPSYKREVVPYVTGEKNFLRLPNDKIEIFTSNEDKIYAYIKNVEDNREKPNEEKVKELPKPVIDVNTAVALDIKPTEIDKVAVEKEFIEEKVAKFKEVTKYHKVKKGENLSEIADKYNVSLSEIKKWNRLKNNVAQKGKNLKIITETKVMVAVKKEVKPSKNIEIVAPKTEVAVNEIPTTEPAKISEIAKQIEKNRKEVVEKINSKKESIAKAEKENVAPTTYVAQKGDNLFAVAQKFNTTVEVLKELNKLKSTNLVKGKKLKLPKLDGLQPENDKVATKDYVVSAGDNLQKLALKNNTTIDKLKELNHISGNTINVGQKLQLPMNFVEQKIAENKAKKPKFKEKLYYVKQGDSLYSISKKFPGVSVADIEQWNNIDGKDLKPGMKLKING